jgi:hypothetical protein
MMSRQNFPAESFIHPAISISRRRELNQCGKAIPTTSATEKICHRFCHVQRTHLWYWTHKKELHNDKKVSIFLSKASFV